MDRFLSETKDHQYWADCQKADFAHAIASWQKLAEREVWDIQSGKLGTNSSRVTNDNADTIDHITSTNLLPANLTMLNSADTI